MVIMSRYGVRGADRLSTGRWQGQGTGYNRSGGPGRIEFLVMELVVERTTGTHCSALSYSTTNEESQ